MGKCTECGAEFRQPLQGRPRKYCEVCSPKRNRAPRPPRLLQFPGPKRESGSESADSSPVPSILVQTIKELTAAGVMESSEAAAAVKLAALFDTGAFSATGASYLWKAHREALDLALSGAAVKQADVIDLIFNESG